MSLYDTSRNGFTIVTQWLIINEWEDNNTTADDDNLVDIVKVEYNGRED